MRVVIPNSARLQGIENFLKKIEDPGTGDLEIHLPYRAFSVHPMVIAATAVAGLAAIDRNDKVSITGHTDGSGAVYLTRMGLFSALGIPPPVDIREHESAGRFVPLRIVTNGSELTRFIQDLAPLLHRQREETAAISYAVAELVRNTIEHSGPDARAAVSAQYYKKSGVIGLGVADCGIGIPRSLGYWHAVGDDLEAIELAMRPGVSGTTKRVGGTENNAGAGLFFCKGMAFTSRNYFVIASGSGMYKLLPERPQKPVNKIFINASDDRATRRLGETDWRGTLVGLDIAGDAHGTFPGFLQLMRDAYHVEVREAQAAKAKKGAKFT